MEGHFMKNANRVSLALVVLVSAIFVRPAPAAEQQFRRLPVKEYRDKMKAGWIGQIIGVSWGRADRGALQPDHARGQDAAVP